jgi:hypothetical protein
MGGVTQDMWTGVCPHCGHMHDEGEFCIRGLPGWTAPAEHDDRREPVAPTPEQVRGAE